MSHWMSYKTGAREPSLDGWWAPENNLMFTTDPFGVEQAASETG